MENEHEILKNEFNSYVVRWGSFTNLFGVLLVLIPCVVLWMYFGAAPTWSAVVSGVIMVFSASGAYYFVEPISYFTSLGMAGTYMSFLSGNISNMRVPCSIIAQEAAGVELGSNKGNLISTVGIAVSVVVNALILTVAILFGSALLEALPDEVKKTFDYMIPALFATMLATAVIANRRVAMYGVPLGLILTAALKFGYIDFVPSVARVAVVLISSVVGTIALGLVTEK